MEGVHNSTAVELCTPVFLDKKSRGRVAARGVTRGGRLVFKTGLRTRVSQ